MATTFVSKATIRRTDSYNTKIMSCSVSKDIQQQKSFGAELAKVFPLSEKSDANFTEICRAYQKALQAQARLNS